MFPQRFVNSPRVRSLKNVPIFSRCTGRELRRIASLTTNLRVEAGRVLTIASKPGTEFFVIIKGTATVWREGIELDVVGPGSFFGEVALLNDGVRTATVVSNTDMELLVASFKEFRSSHFLVPPVMELMLAVMSERLRRADEGWTENATCAESDVRQIASLGNSSQPHVIQRSTVNHDRQEADT